MDRWLKEYENPPSNKVIWDKFTGWKLRYVGCHWDYYVDGEIVAVVVHQANWKWKIFEPLQFGEEANTPKANMRKVEHLLNKNKLGVRSDG